MGKEDDSIRTHLACQCSPSGKAAEDMALKYAILRHEGVDQPHFDLLFEMSPGSELAAWRSDTWPIQGCQLAHRIKDHRREYLEFEGEVSGGRGRVRRVEAGECDIQASPDQWVITFPASNIPLVLNRIPDRLDEWVASHQVQSGQ